MLGGAPFGYRYIRKTDRRRRPLRDHRRTRPTRRRSVPPLRRRASPSPSWPGGWPAAGVATRTGKPRWDRSVIWGMLRNPAYAGRAVSARPGATSKPGSTASPGCRDAPARRHRDRPREDWLEIAGPGPGATRTPSPACAQRLADNKSSPPATARSPPCSRAWPPAPLRIRLLPRPHTPPPATRSTTTGASARTTTATRTAGSAATSRSAPTTSTPVVWDHITGLLADPALIRAEIDRRLDQLRTADPATAQRHGSSAPWPRPPPRSPG